MFNRIGLTIRRLAATPALSAGSLVRCYSSMMPRMGSSIQSSVASLPPLVFKAAARSVGPLDNFWGRLPNLTIVRNLNRNARRPKKANHGQRPCNHCRRRARKLIIKSRGYKEKIFGFCYAIYQAINLTRAAHHKIVVEMDESEQHVQSFMALDYNRIPTVNKRNYILFLLKGDRPS